MAVYKIFPSQDASIYSAYPAMNTGLDAILDVGNSVTSSNPTAQVARSLIKFDNSEINNVINNIAPGFITGSNWRGSTSGSQEGGNWEACLKAYVAKADGVLIDSFIEVYPISGSWFNGSGQYLDNQVITNGCSWVYRTFSQSAATDGAGNPKGKWMTSGFGTGATGSFSGSDNAGGGNWYWTAGANGYNGIDAFTGSQYTQSFGLRSQKDLNIDVTNYIKIWYSSSNNLIAPSSQTNIANEGFMVKWQDEREFVTNFAESPQIAYYAIDTNTIYPPTLEIKWRDFSYATTIGAVKTGTFLSGSNFPTVPGDTNFPTINNSASLSPFNSPITFANFTASRVGTGSGDNIHIDLTMNGHSITRAKVTKGGEGYKAGDKIRITSQSILDEQLIDFVSGDLDFVLLSTQIDNLDVIDTPDMFVALDDNPGIFYSESINKFRLNVRPDFPRRTFLTSSIETQNHALPSASYYAIKDLDTNEYVVDFDTKYTQISCDVTGSHFTVYMNGLEPERYYQILVQTTVNGNTIVKDEEYYFKVVNG